MDINYRAIIEAILFVAGDEGVLLEQIASTFDLTEQEMMPKMDAIVLEYNEDENKGLEIVNYGHRYKLVTKASTHDYCQKIFSEETNKQFSQAALETLAIIAYKQPITRVEIEEIRGVSCDMMIRKLLAKNLIQESGRLDTAGKPFQYSVTDEFMDTFKLKSLDELPKLPDYKEEKEEGELFD